MGCDPSAPDLPDSNGSAGRRTRQPEVVQPREDPSAGLALEPEAEPTVSPARLDHPGRIGLGPRDPLGFPPRSAWHAETAHGLALPLLEGGRSRRLAERAGEKRDRLLVPPRREVIQKLFDYGAGRFGKHVPPQGGDERDECDRRDRNNGETEKALHDPNFEQGVCRRAVRIAGQATFLRSRIRALSDWRSPRRAVASFSTGSKCRSIVRPRSKEFRTDG